MRLSGELDGRLRSLDEFILTLSTLLGFTRMPAVSFAFLQNEGRA